MKNNYDLMENNEVGKNAMGGTEMYTRFVYDGTIPRDILEHFQIIPSRLREIREDKIRIYFEHNLPNDPESVVLKDPEIRSKFHKIVFLSNWHYQQFMSYLGVPYSTQSCVIEGGFLPNTKLHIDKPDPAEVVNLAYFSTPQRGLELLIPVFIKLAETDKKIHLHVHSSFKIYGWEENDKQFEALYQACRDHPQITYHGFTKHEELQKMIEDYHIFAYPNIWPETMCRAVLEAMSAEMLCVHPNLAALPDTTGCLNRYMYSGTSNNQEHANMFFALLSKAIEEVRSKSEGLTKELEYNKFYVDRRYNVDWVHMKWQAMLVDLIQRYPTVESRKIIVPEAKPQSDGFNYNYGR